MLDSDDSDLEEDVMVLPKDGDPPEGVVEPLLMDTGDELTP